MAQEKHTLDNANSLQTPEKCLPTAQTQSSVNSSSFFYNNLGATAPEKKINNEQLFKQLFIYWTLDKLRSERARARGRARARPSSEQ